MVTLLWRHGSSGNLSQAGQAEGHHSRQEKSISKGTEAWIARRLQEVVTGWVGRKRSIKKPVREGELGMAGAGHRGRLCLCRVKGQACRAEGRGRSLWKGWVGIGREIGLHAAGQTDRQTETHKGRLCVLIHSLEEGNEEVRLNEGSVEQGAHTWVPGREGAREGAW